MTAADRPSVTDDARAEAIEAAARWLDRIYPNGLVAKKSVLADLAEWADRAKRGVHPSGREWAAGRAETTTEDAEDAARVLYLHDRHDITPPGFGERMWAEGHADGGVRQKYLGYAQALADAGLLATARTRPTREEVARDLFHHVYPDQEWDASDGGPFLRAADAVLGLLRGGGDDQ